MENMTLDTQASLDPQGGIAPFTKAQGKSSLGSRNGRSASFTSVLNEETVEMIDNEASTEKINKDPDDETINFEFAAISGLKPIDFGMAPRLHKDSPGFTKEAMTPIPLMDKAQCAVLSISSRKTRGYFTENTQQTALPMHAEVNPLLSGSSNRVTAANGPGGINTQAVIDQIVDAKQSLNNGSGGVRITLDPPNLGTVNLEIAFHKERAEVVMTADNPGVQQALQSRVDDIRTALQHQDLKIENFQILLQDNATNQQQVSSHTAFGQLQEHQIRQNHMDDGLPIQPFIQTTRQSESMRGWVPQPGKREVRGQVDQAQTNNTLSEAASNP